MNTKAQAQIRMPLLSGTFGMSSLIMVALEKKQLGNLLILTSSIKAGEF